MRARLSVALWRGLPDSGNGVQGYRYRSTSLYKSLECALVVSSRRDHLSVFV